MTFATGFIGGDSFTCVIAFPCCHKNSKCLLSVCAAFVAIERPLLSLRGRSTAAAALLSSTLSRLGVRAYRSAAHIKEAARRSEMLYLYKRYRQREFGIGRPQFCWPRLRAAASRGWTR
jgi:hypothetical protein